MKANMFTKPEIASAMGNFVLVDLYADGTDAASEENQKLELDKFKTIAEPYYAILDPDENVIATFPGLTKDVAEFSAFLAKGNARPAAAPAEAAPSDGIPKVSKLDGAAIDPASLKGKVVVVNFWATWCVPCISEFPSFNKLHQELGAKGVAVLGVAMDEEGAQRVNPFLKKHALEYDIALGSPEISNQYKLDELPVTLVFDRTGKQIKRFEGRLTDAELQAAVQQVL
jgi:thiol:disulfide interchange protein DsbD